MEALKTKEAKASTTEVGYPRERVEDAALLRGAGRYGDDLATTAGTLQAAVLRSPHAHARLNAIDTSAALAIEGVHTVLTGEDVRAWAAPFAVGVRQPMQHWCLAVDKVRYVGEPVAVVVARNRYVAEDALDVIELDYDLLDPVIDPETAAGANAPVLHEDVGTNVVNDRPFSYGDPDREFAEAAHRIALKVRYPRSSCTPIECYVVIADYDIAAGTYDVTANFQGPYALHSVMARALKVGSSGLRLRTPPDSGGSFGIKQGVFAYVVLMALAARKAGAPVKWVEDRLEHLQGSSSATNRVTEIEAAVSAEGRVSALRYDQLEDCGAYLRAPEPATLYRMHGTLTGAYDIQSLEVRNRVVLTNKTPCGLNRGFGGPQVYYALERLMQRIAVELDLDPLEVIRRNLVPANAFPYRAPAGSLLDSGDYQSAIERGVAQGGLDELKQRRDAARREGRLYGIGFCAVVEPSISNMGYITAAMTPAEREKAGPKNGAVATATVSVDPLGGVTVHVSSTPQGQGHRTAAAQVVADMLGLDFEKITVNVELDTQKDPWSNASGNYSSRFAGAVAGTVHEAASRIRKRVAAIAAYQFQVDATRIRFAGGQVTVANDDRYSASFRRVAGTAHWAPGQLPENEAGGLRETAFWSPPQLEAPDAGDHINSSLCYGLVFDYCGVEVDTVTGRVRFDRYVTLHDAGRILNPALLEGQVRGGFAQGLGAALMEKFEYGADGSFQAGTLADYLIPTTMEVPEPVILHMETPSPFTPLGSKGAGEGNNMSTPVCIANAVADALGERDIELPLTPSRIRALVGIDEPAPPEGLEPVKPAAGNGSALQASESVEMPGDPETVFNAILDPKILAKIIPGCHDLQAVGDHSYQADVTVGVGMIRARYKADVNLSELDPPHSLKLGGLGRSAMGVAEGSARVRLTEIEGNRTRLDYDYEAAIGGKFAAVGARMLQGAARVIIGQIFSRLAAELGGGSSAGAWWRRLIDMIRSLFGRSKK